MEEPTGEKERAEFLVYATEKHQELSKEYIPRLLGNDPTLTELDLQSKYVTDVSAASLAEALSGNTCLTSLNLADNFVEYKGIAAIADMLRANSSLQQLNLARNDLHQQGCLELLDALQQNHTLNLIELEGNAKVEDSLLNDIYCGVKLNTQPKVLKETLLKMRIPPTKLHLDEVLRVIDLSYNVTMEHELDKSKFANDGHLDDFSARMLAEGLKFNATVEILRLAYNNICDDGACHLAYMLEDNTTLDEINLFGNSVAALGANAFIEVLQDHNNYLTKLNLQSNGVSETLLIELEWSIVLNRQPLNLKKFIIPLRENSEDLISLHFDEHLSQRYYDDISARILADALQNNHHLTSLSMPNNRVTEVGARFIADMLLVNSTLKHLDLCNNQIGNGVKWLSQALKGNHVLSSFVLSNNNIEDDGAFEIANMLTVNDSIVELDLRNNNIRKSGAAFARAFHVNTTLQDLFMEGNKISESLMKEIQQGRLLNAEPKLIRQYLPLLHSNAEDIITLDLTYDVENCDSPLSDNSASMLANALKENYVLTSLNLADNEIGINGLRDICEALDANPHTLKHLGISRNHDLGEDAAELMCRTLFWHKALTSIDMSYNYIGEEGARHFLQHVRKHDKLKFLNIEGCRSSKPTAKELQVLVASNTQPRGLKEKLLAFFSNSDPQFTGTPICDFSRYDNLEEWDGGEDSYNRSAEVVAMVLEGNNDFQTFRFAHNRMGDKGCIAFCDLFSHSCSFTSIDLSYNHLTDEGAKALIELAKTRYELLQVNLEGNKYVSSTVLSQVKYYLQYNRQPKELKDLLIKLEANHSSFNTVDVSDTVKSHMTDISVVYLCDAMKQNDSVTTMNLSNNHIALNGAVQLAQMLKTNTGITTFSLNNNILDGWEPAECFSGMLKENSTLKKLSLRANDLDDAAVKFFLNALKHNDTLTALDLRDNKISSHNLNLIGDAINLNSQSLLKRTLPSLSENSAVDLDLSNRGYDDRCVKSLALSLAENNSLITLDLSKNIITDLSIEALSNVLAEHNSLRILNLSHNKIEAAGTSMLAKALKINKRLTQLNLSYNHIRDNCIPTIREMLLSNNTLLDLNLDGNDLPEPVIDEVASMCLNSQPMLKNALPQISENAVTLRKLDFSRGQKVGDLEQLETYDETSLKSVCTHNNVTCKLISQPLIENTNLTTLNLSNGLINDIGVYSLTQMLMQNRIISQIHLANCELTNKSAEYFSGVLLVNDCITNLSLRSNSIQEEGAESLINSLMPNHTCTYLNLDNNPIADNVLKRLNFALTLNTQPLPLKLALPDIRDDTIARLQFGFEERDTARKFDDVSAKILADALSLNKSVTFLDLSGNKITETGAIYLAEMLLNNSTLQMLNLARNSINHGASGFLDALKTNITLRDLNLNHNDVHQWQSERIDTLVTLNNHPLEMKSCIIKMMQRDNMLTQVKINLLTDVSSIDGRPIVPEQQLSQDGVAPRAQWINDAAVMLLSEYLKTDISVTDVDLGYNRITDIGCRYLADALKINKEGLRRVNLSRNVIADEGGVAMARTLLTNTSVTDLDLSFNVMTDATGVEFVNLVKHNKTLKRVEIHNNYISLTRVKDVDLLVRLNSKGLQLKSLLTKAMDDDETLKYLNLGEFRSRGWWDADCTKLVADALERNYNIHGVACCFNDITDVDIPNIVRIIEHKNLQELDLSNNYLSDMESVAQSLLTNASLTKLDLGCNKIDAPNCLEICKMLRHNDTLKELNLRGNLFGDVGCRHLVEALKYNGGLQFINVDNNNVSDKLKEELQHAISVNYKVWEAHDKEDAALQQRIREEQQ